FGVTRGASVVVVPLRVSAVVLMKPDPVATTLAPTCENVTIYAPREVAVCAIRTAIAQKIGRYMVLPPEVNENGDIVMAAPRRRGGRFKSLASSPEAVILRGRSHESKKFLDQSARSIQSRGGETSTPRRGSPSGAKGACGARIGGQRIVRHKSGLPGLAVVGA